MIVAGAEQSGLLPRQPEMKGKVAMKTRGKLSVFVHKNPVGWICAIAAALAFASAHRCAAQTANPIVVPTINDLRALNPMAFTNNTVVLVNDYYTNNVQRGRGGGFFRWFTNSSNIPNSGTIADDGGRYIGTTSAPNGIWERMLQGETANVKMWGAKGDNTNDDYIAIQNAINACENQSWTAELLFPAGYYRVTNTLVFQSYLHIRGEGVGVNTEIHMPVGVHTNIFQTLYASMAIARTLNPTFDFDQDLIFENLFIQFDGGDGTADTNNAALVVCQPGEAASIRNIWTSNGGYGIRCFGPGAPGLRIRDVMSYEPRVAAVSIEPLPGNAYASGGPATSIIGLDGDSYYNSTVPTASLLFVSNCIVCVSLTDTKAEGGWGGGLVQYKWPDTNSWTQGGAFGQVNIRSCSYLNAAGSGNDFVVLKGGGVRTPSVSLSMIDFVNGGHSLINDQLTGRIVAADTDQSSANFSLARIPMLYESASYTAIPWSSLVVGQTALSYLYATNTGWYRVMGSIGGSQQLSGKLVMTTLRGESTELQVDVNPWGGANAVWLNVTRATANNATIPPVITQARAFFYWATGYGYLCYLDVYVGNPVSSSQPWWLQRITFAHDINGYVSLDGNNQLIGQAIPVSTTLPSGTIASASVNTYR
jgi:hypothetical protein